MEFIILATSVIAVLGWFTAGWKWIDAAHWMSEAEWNQTELAKDDSKNKQLQNQLAEADTELRRWRDRYSIEAERVA